MSISIHAPIKGATGYSVVIDTREEISIHAPIKGATLGAVINWYSLLFQSTHP